MSTLWEQKEELARLKKEAVWIAHSLFERGKTSGTTANISFRFNNRIYISCSGSCFGTLSEEDLIEAQNPAEGKKPSKELTLHKILYEAHSEVQAVIHTHSPSAVLWSCVGHDDPRDVMGHDTPYLDMKLGKVAEVPYAPPGSEELFAAMRECVGEERGYLLRHHGGIVGGLSLMNAFEAIEELEQSAWICWQLRNDRNRIPEKERYK